MSATANRRNGDPSRAGETPMGRRLLWAVLLTPLRAAAHLAAAAVFLLVAVRMAPQYKAVYLDFELELPAATLGVIAIADFLARYWYLAAAAVIFLDAPLMFVLQLAPDRWQWIGRLWFSTYLLLIICAIGYIMFTLSFPLDALIDDLALSEITQWRGGTAG